MIVDMGEANSALRDMLHPRRKRVAYLSLALDLVTEYLGEYLTFLSPIVRTSQMH